MTNPLSERENEPVAERTHTKGPDPRPRRRYIGVIAKILLPLLLIGAGLGGFYLLKLTKTEVRQRVQREKVWPVNAQVAKFSDYQPKLRLFGETISGRKVELRALVAGEIVTTGTKFREGGIVKKGDMLIRVDPFQFKGALIDAKARLAEAEGRLREIEAMISLEMDALKYEREQLEIAKRDLARAVPLAKKGTVSKKLEDDRRLVVSQRQQSARQRQNNLKIQQAKYEQQKATIRRLQWGVDQAERNLRDTELKAPFDAYVNGINADIGRIVSANDRIATLLDKNWIDVRFILSDSQYGRILSSEKTLFGRDIDVRWYVGSKPLSYKAKIERISAEISSESGGVEIYARINDPTAQSPIRAGAFVQIHVPDQNYKNVIRISQTALYDGDRIYIIKEGRLEGRKIEVVGTAGTDILLRGPVKKGEKILLTRLSTAGDGVKVHERKSEDIKPISQTRDRLQSTSGKFKPKNSKRERPQASKSTEYSRENR